MSDVDANEMDEEARDAFLGAGGTGVIALSASEGVAPHAVPVSYGYDTTEDVFYFRLSAGEGSAKGELSERAVTFVTYGAPDEEWRSVVAKGRLQSTTEESVAIESLEGLRQVQIPLVEMFDRPTADVTFEFYRLDPDEITGRKETPAGA